MKTEKELSAAILDILRKIKNDYPELSKYLDELPITIPDEKDPLITSDKLLSYYDSLKSIYQKFKLEHPTGDSKVNKCCPK